MKAFKHILFVILLTIPAVKFAQYVDQDQAHIENEPPEEGFNRAEQLEEPEPSVSTHDQVNRAGPGRVYVYYGTSHHRPYHNRRYYYHRRGYPYGPYYYRYYYYPYQRPTRYYKRGW